MSLGQKMRERREALGLSLQDVANRAGTRKQYVWELEMARREPNPSVNTLVGLAAALQMPAVDLFRECLK